MKRSQEHEPIQAHNYLDTANKSFKDQLRQDQSLREVFEAWLQKHDGGYLTDFKLFIDEGVEVDQETLRVLIKNFNFMLNGQGKVDKVIPIPAAPGSMSIMGRPIHPHVAAQIEREWSNTTTRLKLRSIILSDEKLIAKDKSVILGILDREVPLKVVKDWYANLISAKLETSSPAYNQLLQSYSEVLQLLIKLHSQPLDDKQHTALVQTFTDIDTNIETINGKLRAITESL